MADKKITALNALDAAGKVSATDLLHIIDYSASPVNKKITVAHLFDQANCAITSYGAFTHDFGASAGASGLSVVVPNATPAASAETEVVVNDDGNAYVDFRVQTSLNDTAFHIDSSIDSGAGNCNTITINGGAIASTKKVDFKVNSSTGILVHCDSTDHVVGFGTAAPDTAYIADFAAVSGKSIKTAGGIDVTGVSTFTGNTTVTGTGTITGNTTVGTATAGVLALSSVESVTYASGNSNKPSNSKTTSLLTITTGASTGGLDDGTIAGQIKIIHCVARSGSGAYTMTPDNLNGWSSILFNAKDESVMLMWHSGGWVVINIAGATLA